ncbi:LIPaSe related [Aphelenchoides bicaudatus]|nr:LIPaSe related [Aphelenchoides bicaudatus]
MVSIVFTSSLVSQVVLDSFKVETTMFKLTVALFVFVQVANAQFSSGFQQFLAKKYGQDYANLMLRADLVGTNNGSCGGSSDSKRFKLDKSDPDPVVLVHGVGASALFEVPIKNFLESHGYKAGSVRRLIVAVREYTNRNVNVVGYSLGSVMSRYAILGGRCVDTNEYLGLPLTLIVNRFVSVAELTLVSITHDYIGFCPQNQNYQICTNQLTGVAPSPANSAVLAKINKFKHYEGKQTFIVGSTSDAVVLYKDVYLNNADTNVTLSGFTHATAIIFAPNIQYEALTNGCVSQTAINTDAQLFVSAYPTIPLSASGSVTKQPRRCNN